MDMMARGMAQKNASQLSDMAKQEIRKDFVKYIAKNVSYSRMRIKRTDLSASLGAGMFAIDVVLDDGGTNHMTYQWRKDLHDDFTKLQNVFCGGFSPALLQKVLPTLTGSAFSTGSVASYTTNVGDYFTASFVGDEVRFNYYSDNRGGVWSFVIDNDTAHPITVSTWSTSVVGVNTAVIKTGLTYGSHTIKATFTGADPNHAPNGGTARGWLRYLTSATNATDFAINSYQQNNVDVSELMGSGSNSEFAIVGTKNSETVYFPEHNNIGTCFNAVPMTVTVDNSVIDFGTLIDQQYLSCSYVQITESMYFKFPSLQTNSARLDITYVIGMDGILSVSGKITVLDAFTASGYHAMLPMGTALNTLVTGLGNKAVCAYDDSNYFFQKERDVTYSFCGVSPINKNYIFAMTVDNPYYTLRSGKANRKRLDQFTFFWQRSVSNGAPKVYLQPYDNASLGVGDTMEFYARYGAGVIANVYDAVT